MTHELPQDVTPATTLGFVVAGVSKDAGSVVSARLIPILAVDHTDALERASRCHQGFMPTGSISEIEVRDILDKCGATRAAAPANALPIHVVAGYVGDTHAGPAKVLCFAAQSVIDAQARALEQESQFHIVGVLTEDDLLVQLGEINALRAEKAL